MDKVLIRMIATEAPIPEVIFVGPQDKAKAMLFRVIYNAESGYGKVEDENGIHITVNEIRFGKRNTQVIKEVHYFLQNAKRD